MKDSHAAMLGVVGMVVALGVLLLTLFVLVQAGYWWLAFVVIAPLAYGLARWPFWLMAKVRPDWFKPGWLKENGFEQRN